MKSLLTLLVALSLLVPQVAQAKPITYQWVSAIKLQNGTQRQVTADRHIIWVHESLIDFYVPQTQQSVDAAIAAIPKTKPSYLALWSNTVLVSFNDPKWSTFIANMGYLGNSARKYGYLGILWDDEPYTEKNLYYDPYGGKVTSHNTMVRQKAREYASAVGKGLNLGSYVALGQMGIEPGHRGMYSHVYTMFWREVRRTHKTLIFYEEPYTYRDHRYGWFNNFVKETMGAIPCTGFDREHYGKNLGCRWLYLES